MDPQKMVEALMKPEAYDEKVTGGIKLIQTHISWIFLTGKYAYKIKKPVNFGFLDFTTLESRRRYIELELELNRRLCPGIYLAALPINEKDGALKIGGEGEAVEYALKMKQVPQDRLMDRLLEKGKVGRKEIGAIAKMLAEFHSKAETSDEIAGFGGPEKLRINWEENFSQVQPFVGQVISMEDFDSAKKKIECFMEGSRALFEKRAQQKRIRRIHGDLHSGNIFIISGKPCIFDCIEFNMRFSCLDTAADVAFLSMDLDSRKQVELSGFLVDKYMHYSGDFEMIKLLGFYKCYYAWVRGKVTAFRLNENLDEESRRKIAESSRKYFKLALDYSRWLK